MSRFLLTALAIAVLMPATFVTPASAQQAPQNEVPRPLSEGLRRGVFLEQYIAQTLRRLRDADRDRNGLDRDDIEFATAREKAQARAAAIGQLLAFDLDGDLEVTRAELELGRNRPNAANNFAEAKLRELDADGNGVITLEEITGFVPERPNDARVESLLALDPNGDGRLTVEELKKLAEDAFRTADLNGDGEISEQEGRQLVQQRRGTAIMEGGAACKLPEVPGDARLVVFASNGGAALSSVSIGSADKETSLIDVNVEPGTVPLYLVLVSQKSVVWHLVGATDRVANVVVSSSARGLENIAASGVMGVAAEVVTISTFRCPPYIQELKETSRDRMRASVWGATGKNPDEIFWNYRTQQVNLPSGTIASPERPAAAAPDDFDAALWAEAVRRWPAGLASLDRRQIVAKASVEDYQVLPGEMGLSQLVGSGAVEQKSSREFRVVKEIAHMPTNLNPQKNLTIAFAKGVPLPPGNSPNICIILEGDSLSGASNSRCLRY